MPCIWPKGVNDRACPSKGWRGLVCESCIWLENTPIADIKKVTPRNIKEKNSGKDFNTGKTKFI
jgi:hypothetical protein